jgi:protein gp37
MAHNTKIEWCDHTFNIAWGCVKVSPGCKNCYANTFANRWGYDAWGPGGTRRLFEAPHWAEPVAWNREAAGLGERRRVFCSSMTDVFLDERALDSERARLWDLIEATPSLDWLLLTKRPEVVMDMVPSGGYWRNQWGQLPANVQVGTSIENQEEARKRLPLLFRIPAQLRFVSFEPLLAGIPSLFEGTDTHEGEMMMCKRCGAGVWDTEHYCPNCHSDYKLEWMPSEMLHWAIAGGESGPGARPMEYQWLKELQQDCAVLQIPFFFKQTGSVLAKKWGLLHPKGGDPTEWPHNLVLPREFPDERMNELHLLRA